MGNYKGLTPREALYRSVYANYKHDAKRRGHDFNLTFEFFYQLVTSNCYLCDKKPSNRFKRKNKTIKYSGIDRINTALGYLDSNVAPCCRRCNQSKMDRSLEEYFLHIAKIIKYSASLVPLRRKLIELETD
jgi:hypothetical protein